MLPSALKLNRSVKEKDAYTIKKVTIFSNGFAKCNKGSALIALICLTRFY